MRISKERIRFLKQELKEYEKITPMTEEERRELHGWIEAGYSVHENTCCAVGDGNRPKTSRKGNNGMTHQSSIAYACVAYRIMEYEGQEMSEEYLSLLMEMLYDFYTESEIKKVYLDNVRLDAYETMLRNGE